MTLTTERMKRAEDRLDEALNAGETPFKLATTVTACWRYSIGDVDGAAYGLTEYGLEVWQLIERVIKFERAKVNPPPPITSQAINEAYERGWSDALECSMTD
jgi:hypothetical protein